MVGLRLHPLASGLRWLNPETCTYRTIDVSNDYHPILLPS